MTTPHPTSDTLEDLLNDELFRDDAPLDLGLPLPKNEADPLVPEIDMNIAPPTPVKDVRGESLHGSAESPTTPRRTSEGGETRRREVASARRQKQRLAAAASAGTDSDASDVSRTARKERRVTRKKGKETDGTAEEADGATPKKVVKRVVVKKSSDGTKKIVKKTEKAELPVEPSDERKQVPKKTEKVVDQDATAADTKDAPDVAGTAATSAQPNSAKGDASKTSVHEAGLCACQKLFAKTCTAPPAGDMPDDPMAAVLQSLPTSCQLCGDTIEPLQAFHALSSTITAEMASANKELHQYKQKYDVLHREHERLDADAAQRTMEAKQAKERLLDTERQLSTVTNQLARATERTGRLEAEQEALTRKVKNLESAHQQRDTTGDPYEALARLPEATAAQRQVATMLLWLQQQGTPKERDSFAALFADVMGTSLDDVLEAMTRAPRPATAGTVSESGNLYHDVLFEKDWPAFSATAQAMATRRGEGTLDLARDPEETKADEEAEDMDEVEELFLTLERLGLPDDAVDLDDYFDFQDYLVNAEPTDEDTASIVSAGTTATTGTTALDGGAVWQDTAFTEMLLEVDVRPALYSMPLRGAWNVSEEDILDMLRGGALYLKADIAKIQETERKEDMSDDGQDDDTSVGEDVPCALCDRLAPKCHYVGGDRSAQGLNKAAAMVANFLDDSDDDNDAPGPSASAEEEEEEDDTLTRRPSAGAGPGVPETLYTLDRTCYERLLAVRDLLDYARRLPKLYRQRHDTTTAQTPVTTPLLYLHLQQLKRRVFMARTMAIGFFATWDMGQLLACASNARR